MVAPGEGLEQVLAVRARRALGGVGEGPEQADGRVARTTNQELDQVRLVQEALPAEVVDGPGQRLLGHPRRVVGQRPGRTGYGEAELAGSVAPAELRPVNDYALPGVVTGSGDVEGERRSQLSEHQRVDFSPHSGVFRHPRLSDRPRFSAHPVKRAELAVLPPQADKKVQSLRVGQGLA